MAAIPETERVRWQQAMFTGSTRRDFFKNSAAGTALLGLGGLGLMGRMPAVSARQANLDPNLVRLDPGIEPLVQFLEETPRDTLLEEVADRIRKGLTYRELVTALFLAAVRNILPTGRFNFHCFLMVHAAHQASLASPDNERWLPIFWVLDEFKRAKGPQVDVEKMPPIDESKLPSLGNARQAFFTAADDLDFPAAEAAVVTLLRNGAVDELFDQLAVHGARRDFPGLGHPSIWVSNAWRTLPVVGWQHAEAVLRSVALLVFAGDRDPRCLRIWQHNRELAAKVPGGWMEGQSSPEATTDLLAAIRQASAEDAARNAVELLEAGVAPQSVWDAAFLAAGELLMRHPARPERWGNGLIPIHAATSLNALRYAYGTAAQDDSRRFLLLQSVAVVPTFRERLRLQDGQIDQMEPAMLTTSGLEAAGEIFTDIGTDRSLAARKALAYLEGGASPQVLIDAARRLAFYKGNNTHDYKFTAAVFEDFEHLSPQYRNRFLASCMYIFRGTAEKDIPLVDRSRAALKS
jgi:hypothetical protein